MNKFKQFSSKKQINEGAQLNLVAASGEMTEYTITVVNEYSKPYKMKYLDYLHLVSEGKIKATPENYTKYVLAYCVISWTIPGVECTPENVNELLIEAPHIEGDVRRLIFNTQDFFKVARLNSSISPSDTSDSVKPTVTE